MHAIPKLSDIEALLAQADTDALVPLNVSVLRNVMVDALTPYLRYLGHRSGLDVSVGYGEYDNVFQEAVGGQTDLLTPDTDAVLVFLHLDTLSPDLADRFNSLSVEAREAEKERILGHCMAIMDGIRAQTKAMILWHGFEPRAHPSLGAFDAQTDAGQNATIAALNTEIRNQLRQRANCYFVDMGLLVVRVGLERFHDLRWWHVGRAPYTRDGLAEVARENVKFLAALKGCNRKCLVLDCDNTLWGGVIGEDGIEGIKLGPTHPGSQFLEFQREVLALHDRGIILALNSKNNEADVWEVFDNHPDMALTREHIAAWRVNWNDKATNLRELATELNIGLGHMVFADDSDAEVALVRRELPQVRVLHMDKSATVAHRRMLASCGLFDTLTVSAEDKLRGAMYRAEAGRRKLRAEVTGSDQTAPQSGTVNNSMNMDGYYRSLEMELTVRLADEFTIPRVAQMTQKTNQFNLTTRRYSEADIKGFADSADHDVLHVQLRDRFGDSGLVGLAIVRYEKTRAEIDTFLLSCRALGRGVERALLAFAARRASERGCSNMGGTWLKTAKNAQVEHFYREAGFALTRDLNGEGRKDFSLDFSSDATVGTMTVPAHFASVHQNVVRRDMI